MVDTVMLALTLKSMRSSSDKTENKKRQSICLVKSVNIPVEEEDLVFIEEYLGYFSCSNGTLNKKYISSVVC